jgi:hypothetical protein
MPTRIPKKATDAVIRNASRMRPAAGSKRALAEAKAAAGKVTLPILKKRKPKLALPPPRTITSPSGRKIRVK